MSEKTDTFFTSVGCMDGRIQVAVIEYGKAKFDAEFPDTITEAGMDRLLAHTDEQIFLENVSKKVLISVDKHNSRGIIVHGHEDCAGNVADDEKHKEDIRKSVEKIKQIIEGKRIDVVGVYVKVKPSIRIEEI